MSFTATLLVQQFDMAPYFAHPGGVLEIFLFILVAGLLANFIGASVHEGIFVGALVRLHPESSACNTRSMQPCAWMCYIASDVIVLLHVMHGLREMYWINQTMHVCLKEQMKARVMSGPMPE